MSKAEKAAYANAYKNTTTHTNTPSKSPLTLHNGAAYLAAHLKKLSAWGKINSQTGTRAVCYCDATIALPLICHALAERVTEKRKGPDMSWIFKDMPKA